MVTLSARPDLLDIAARWGWEEWGRPNGKTLADAMSWRSPSLDPDGFEKGFVLLEDGVPAAMASLVREDLDERPDLTPWLAGVYVDPPFRGRGYARLVVRAVEDAAVAAGVGTLWLYTGTAPGLYRGLGWVDESPLVLASGPALLMRRDLGTLR